VRDTASKKVKQSRKVSGKKVSSKKPGNNKVELWGGIITFDKPTPSAQTKRILSAIDAGLVRFEQHKPALITILRNAHEGVLQPEPFDETKSWSGLTSLARSFFWQARVKQETMPAARRVARLDGLATALKRARAVVDQAMQDDVGNDLFSAWCEGTDEPLVSLVRNDDGSLTTVRMPEEMFKEAVESLATLETAALRAADEANEKRAGRGRQKGTTVLPTGFIEVLATLYRESTGAKPGAGRGPFVRFVFAFLTALGRANISEDYVVELAQDARSWARNHPASGSSSPFDDKP
jgi:hypothetical protein